MSTWQIAAATEEYKNAIKATATLTKDERAVGFVKPHEFEPNFSDTNIQRQNNTLIHLLIQSLEELKELRAQVQTLNDRIVTLEKGKAPVTLPDNVVEQISTQLKEAKFGQPKEGLVKGTKGTFRVWK
uniref:Uncharacterized protein n=1 Tax=Grapevine vein clearing virus TaxID=1050407 RepID=A0A7D5GWY6_9VIRU|nr:hypothetical protein [Grapevine vein clearing virus]QKY59756.1 hypothetical protein [Grapevine vein clearing virus]QKY59763.1 hypothetical protein [Grapevine vein clearing virus]QKY59774.1 hypothetical protein [Grapevine vein clearing virus]QKY59797.1 hypothetical protein [Grapevine vein clearing virus]